MKYDDWEDLFKDNITHWRDTAADTADWQESEMLSKEVFDRAIESFSPEQKGILSSLLKNTRHKTTAHMCRQYQNLFDSVLEEFWGTPPRPQLRLIHGGKKDCPAGRRSRQTNSKR